MDSRSHVVVVVHEFFSTGITCLTNYCTFSDEKERERETFEHDGIRSLRMTSESAFISFFFSALGKLPECLNCAIVDLDSETIIFAYFVDGTLSQFVL